jgi:hypothetical protein
MRENRTSGLTRGRGHLPLSTLLVVLSKGSGQKTADEKGLRYCCVIA